MSASKAQEASEEKLEYVEPEPLPSYEVEDPKGQPEAEEHIRNSTESRHSDRMPSMTDVLNSSPEDPISPKLDRSSVAQSPAAIENDRSLNDSLVTNANEAEDIPPAKPPRPMSPMAQAEKTLKDAFPNMEASVVKAVLIASGGQLDPAFNALLSMSDPGFVPDMPARPEQKGNHQLASDEAYARRLAEELNSQEPYSRGRADPQRPPRTHSARGAPVARQRRDDRYWDRDDDEDKNWSFFDDDLPIIKDNLTKSFNETRQKVNSWVANFKKKLDGEFDDDAEYAYSNNGNINASPTQRSRPIQYNYRLSQNQSYDNDPTVLDDNFTHLNLVDNTVTPPKPPRPTNGNRPLANESLYTTKQADNTKTFRRSFEDDEELYTGPSPSTTRSPDRSATSSKWEPLKAVEPSPDKDPFFVGDSDDDATEDAKRSATSGADKQVRFAEHD
ncbi:hypothetical protein V1511DRAFT_470548 [Dipodascopsis uninucleata]